jgi:hypothetical protein
LNSDGALEAAPPGCVENGSNVGGCNVVPVGGCTLIVAPAPGDMVDGGTAPDVMPGTVVTPVPGAVPPGTVVTPVLPGVGNCTRGCATAHSASNKQTVQVRASNLMGRCTTSESTRRGGEGIQNGAINYQDRQIGSRVIVGTRVWEFGFAGSAGLRCGLALAGLRDRRPGIRRFAGLPYPVRHIWPFAADDRCASTPKAS